jgi:hypothetical protein
MLTKSFKLPFCLKKRFNYVCLERRSLGQTAPKSDSDILILVI